MPTIRVLLFAWLKDAFGGPDITLELPPGSTIASLRAALSSRLSACHAPAHSSAATCAFAVKDAYVDDSQDLTGVSEGAAIPPVSGG